MNIGIVTTWFERGAAYVSRQYMEVLQKEHNVHIYARSGEEYAIGNPEWDFPNVYWSKKINSPFTVTVVNKKEFINWVNENKIEAILFNEQHWWEPLIWCHELGVKTIAYIDYYTEQTLPLFEIYDMLICNTKKHFDAFKWHRGARYIPWGTDVNLFKPIDVNLSNDKVKFFHSCGMNPKRKGTDLLLKALPLINSQNFQLLIHTQTDLYEFYPDLKDLMRGFESTGKLEIIHKTVKAPGLYSKGDIYVYPSRLEGIGLTVAEAIASGLGVIVPDCGPMNEFVRKEFGSVVKVDKYFSRHDGYYWPQNEIDINDLANVMDRYNDSVNTINQIKSNARNYALTYLDWDTNANELNDILRGAFDDKITNDKGTVIKLIRQFEHRGLRKYNKYYLKFPLLFKLLKK